MLGSGEVCVCVRGGVPLLSVSQIFCLQVGVHACSHIRLSVCEALALRLSFPVVDSKTILFVLPFPRDFSLVSACFGFPVSCLDDASGSYSYLHSFPDHTH